MAIGGGQRLSSQSSGQAVLTPAPVWVGGRTRRRGPCPAAAGLMWFWQRSVIRHAVPERTGSYVAGGSGWVVGAGGQVEGLVRAERHAGGVGPLELLVAEVAAYLVQAVLAVACLKLLPR